MLHIHEKVKQWQPLTRKTKALWNSLFGICRIIYKIYKIVFSSRTTSQGSFIPKRFMESVGKIETNSNITLILIEKDTNTLYCPLHTLHLPHQINLEPLFNDKTINYPLIKKCNWLTKYFSPHVLHWIINKKMGECYNVNINCK